jgi:hypothetical protein
MRAKMRPDMGGPMKKMSQKEHRKIEGRNLHINSCPVVSVGHRFQDSPPLPT